MLPEDITYEELHEKYYGLITKKVDFYLHKYSSIPLMRDDLIQECRITLLKAMEKYDAEKGASFETYFSNAINKTLFAVLREYRRKHRGLESLEKIVRL
ncbi:MAG: sigma factor [Clostridia bacterium]|nr:sigma factor [Clostridia bacterium]